MTKQILKTVFLLHILSFLCILFSCKPAIGTPWYPRAAENSKNVPYVTALRVANIPVKPDKSVKNFSDADTYIVSVPNEISEITKELITGTFFFNQKKEKEITGIRFEVEGECVPLVADEYVPVMIKIIPPLNSDYKEIQRTIKIKRSKELTPYLAELKVFGNPVAATEGKDFASAENYTVTVPNERDTLTQDDITVTLFKDKTKKETLKPEIELLVLGGILELPAGTAMPVAVKIKSGTPYADLERFITITRENSETNADVQYPTVKEIKIHSEIVQPLNTSDTYTEAPIYRVELPADKNTVKVSDISMIVTDGTDKSVESTVTLVGSEEVVLEQGKAAYLRLKISPVEPYSTVNKLIIITRKTDGAQEPQSSLPGTAVQKDAFLAGLKVAEKINKEGKQEKQEKPMVQTGSVYTAEVSYQTQFLTADDFIPSVFTDDKKTITITETKVIFLNNLSQLPLEPGKPAAVFIKIQLGEAFKDIVIPLVITRKVPAEGEVLIVRHAHLTAMTIHGTPVQPNQAGAEFSESGVYTVEVPYDIKTLTREDISLSLRDEKNEQSINGTVILNDTDSAVLTAGAVTNIYIMINPDGHDPMQKLVRVKRLSSGNDEPEEIPDEGDGSGGEDLNNTYTPEIIPPGTAFDPKKPATNPKDAAGNYKWIKKIVSGDIDPFEYYQADANGFDASKFDDWIVYISDFEAEGTNVASYTFKDGSWQPDGTYGKKYNGPNFGSGFKAMGNVWFYRYTSRPDRWGGTVPPLHDAAKEKRFYFYRFTAQGTNLPYVPLDNSMFCIDTYSKFLFYYSDPASISGVGVPSGWTDYAAPSSGTHQHFAEPFYMSDPVGYVEADGKVVMYKWIRENITANNYAAQKNPTYTEVAERKPHKPGYSPYRHKVKGKSAVKWELNPEYTVASVSFKKEPSSQTFVQDTTGWFLQVVPKPIPEGETLSYQWCRNTSESSEGGTPVASGGTDSSYTLPTNQTGDFYYYCIVTNTNNKNGKTDSKTTQAVKVTVKPNTAVVRFGCDTAYGSLTASVDGQSIDSGKQLKKGTKVLFTAQAKDGYRPDVWSGLKREAGKKTAVLFVKEDAEISVSFKRQDVPVDFYCDPSHGVLRALVDGKPIQSGAMVELDKTVTFTAEAYPDYRIKSWTGAVPDAEDIRSASVTLTKALEVQAVFEKKPVIAISDETFPIHFSCNPVYGIVSAKVEKAGTLPEKAITDGNKVQKGRNVTFTCTPSEDYQLVGWKGADAVPNTLTAVLTVEKETSVEPLFKKKEFAVHFSCDTSRGEITAQVKGESKTLTSGDLIEKGKTVIFTAAPKTDCRVNTWEGLEDTAAADSKETVVTGEITVSVSFKKSFPVHFACETEKGSLTGKALGKDISSGEKLEEGTQVLFTAKAGEDYLIDQWFGLTAAAGSPGASIKVNEDTKPVWLTFKKKIVKVSFSGDNGNEHGKVTAAVNGKTINSGDSVEKGSVVLFTAKANDGYEAGSWSPAAELSVSTDKKYASLVVSSAATVTASFVKQPERVKVNLDYDSTKGHLSAFCDGKLIQSDEMVEKGKIIYFIAEPFAGNRVDDWAGLLQNDVSSDKRRAIARTDSDLAITVSFIKREQMRLTIRPKIYNESLRSWSTADGDHFSPKPINGVHLGHKISAQVQDGQNNFPGNWAEMIAVESNGGKWLRVKRDDFIEIEKEKISNEAIIDEKIVSFSKLKIALTPYLHKANRHDYWWAEWTTLGGGDVYPLQALDDSSSFPLTYNEATGYWTVDTANIQIKNSDDIPLPDEYKDTKPDPNRRISYKGVTVTYDPNFTLADGEEKDFEITYQVNNPETKSEGIIKVIYTIGWK